MAFQLDTVFVWVTDLDRSLDWYEKLGFDAGERHGSWQNMRVGGYTRFALHQGASGDGVSTAVPSFRVGSITTATRSSCSSAERGTDTAGVARTP